MRRVLEKEEMAYFTLLVDMWKRSIEPDMARFKVAMRIRDSAAGGGCRWGGWDTRILNVFGCRLIYILTTRIHSKYVLDYK
jgi:hypothetical protein